MAETNGGPARGERDPELRQALIELARELTRVLRIEYAGPPMARRRGMPARMGARGSGPPARPSGPPGFHPAETDDFDDDER